MCKKEKSTDSKYTPFTIYIIQIQIHHTNTDLLTYIAELKHFLQPTAYTIFAIHIISSQNKPGAYNIYRKVTVCIL